MRPARRFDEPISCHHNYVAKETYDGVDLLVTRKGAIRAGSGELGIIPGSMGTLDVVTTDPGDLARVAAGLGRTLEPVAEVVGPVVVCRFVG